MVGCACWARTGVASKRSAIAITVLMIILGVARTIPAGALMSLSVPLSAFLLEWVGEMALENSSVE